MAALIFLTSLIDVELESLDELDRPSPKEGLNHRLVGSQFL